MNVFWCLAAWKAIAVFFCFYYAPFICYKQTVLTCHYFFSFWSNKPSATKQILWVFFFFLINIKEGDLIHSYKWSLFLVSLMLRSRWNKMVGRESSSRKCKGGVVGWVAFWGRVAMNYSQVLHSINLDCTVGMGRSWNTLGAVLQSLTALGQQVTWGHRNGDPPQKLERELT